MNTSVQPANFGAFSAIGRHQKKVVFRRDNMDSLMEKLNSKLMLMVSGVFLLASFVTEYIVPLAGGNFEFPINPAWVSILISGLPIAYSALSRLLNGFKITSSLLITVAMIAAIYIGEVFAAGEVAFIMALGEWLEHKTVQRTRRGIENLLNLVPKTGRRVMCANGEVVDEIVPAEALSVGDVIRVQPGESFSGDGVIVEGSTTVDLSILTGESLPVDKVQGDDVFAGTINRFGSVDVRLNKAFTDSSLQKMIKMVADAGEKKAPTQKIVDRWASWLVPAAIVIAIITYFVTGAIIDDPQVALVRAVTVLVVFCPCALALATPTSIMAAIGQATKRGVLIKSGEALEQMGLIDTVAFDKTGTLTHGMPVVTDIFAFDTDKTTLLQLAAAVENRSEHPLGKAVLQHARRQGVTVPDAKNFHMEVGRGVSATVEGEQVYCGNVELIEQNVGITIDKDISELAAALSNEGKAVIITTTKQAILGVIGLAAPVKNNAKSAVENLNEAGVQNTVLLTGDNERAANYIANSVGIKQVKANLLPGDKMGYIEQQIQQNINICMVGDGVNDAPALKTACVGVAMGSMGSDIAIEAADIALMGDDLSTLAYVKKLSVATVKSIKFNIALSMAINIGAIVLSSLGLLTPVTGALVHNAGSVLVVLNAARLYDRKFQ